MKRSFDIVFSLLGLIVLSPILALLAIVIKCSDGGPAFFRQERVGQRGKHFRILKFRSMIKNAEDLGLSVTKDGDQRVIPIGRFMRRFKLDELPQLWNVLVGEMSFVGPRPEVPLYVEKYTDAQKKILELKPGITDPASLEFRNEEELLARAGGGRIEQEETEDGTTERRNDGATERRNAEGSRSHRPTVPWSRGPATGKAEASMSHRPIVPGSDSPSAADALEEFYLQQIVPRKIQLSLEYAERATLWSDIEVIVRTVLGRGQGATDYRPQTTDHGQPTTDHGLPTTDHRPRTTDHGGHMASSPPTGVGSR